MKRLIIAIDVPDESAVEIQEWISTHAMLTIRSTGLTRCWTVPTDQIRIEEKFQQTEFLGWWNDTPTC